jgi:hypothetical protein
MKKKKKHPVKYLKYKGCFGNPVNFRTERPEEIVFGEYLGVHDESAFGKMTDSFNEALENPDKVLDMRKIKVINISGGLLLKAFFDEYHIKHRKKPSVRGPADIKMRAVFNHLKIGSYQDVRHHHYKDIDCWQVLSWDDSESKDLHIGKLLNEQIIPKGWKGKHALSENSSTIATSVSEAFYNCKEHAYTGDKKTSEFKRWYLGVGDYPESNSFSFIIYDKGVGIKARLMAEPDGWLDKASDWLKSDSEMIALATKGIRKASAGRGKGLNFAITELTKNNGEVDIYSGYGYFSSDSEHSGETRKPYLQGTLVSFSFPVEYTEGN